MRIARRCTAFMLPRVLFLEQTDGRTDTRIRRRFNTVIVALKNIDKRFYVFFILVTFFTFLTFFIFRNVFFVLKKRWQSSEHLHEFKIQWVHK